MSWLRLDAAFFHSPSSLAIGFYGRLTFLAALCACKSGGNRGRLKKRHFTPEYVALYIGDPEGVTVSNRYEESIQALLDAGLMEIDGSDYVITGWAQRQIDQTNAKRQKRHREKRKANQTVTRQSRSNGDTVLLPTSVVSTRDDAFAGALGGTRDNNETKKPRPKKRPFEYSPVNCYSTEDILAVRTGEKFTLIDKDNGPGPVWIRGSEPPEENIPPVPPEIDQAWNDLIQQRHKQNDAAATA